MDRSIEKLLTKIMEYSSSLLTLEIIYISFFKID